MSDLPAEVQKYLSKRAIKGPWAVAGTRRMDFTGAVVIPSLAEGDSLFATLQSLETNASELRDQFLILVVVNQGEQASDEDRLQNHDDLERLITFFKQTNLSLGWIDATSTGCEIPSKDAGVGFSRKLGLDSALSRLNWQTDPLLVCLDADTLVEEHYLQSIVSHFCQSKKGAAVLPFCHQHADDSEKQSAIDRYELFMRSYVYGLRLAGSPYAFNSVGSAIACRAGAYIRCGGMNSRKAGEDFYFLQKLAKTDGIDLLKGTIVFPEPRVSTRVPFGTGRSMGRLLAGDTDGVLFYPIAVFQILGDWLSMIEKNLHDDAEALLRKASEISPVLVEYLEQAGWRVTWPRLQNNHHSETSRLAAFHVWFDGFRTLRLIHLVCEAGFSRGEPEEMLPDFFLLDNRPCATTVADMLHDLRLFDGTFSGRS